MRFFLLICALPLMLACSGDAHEAGAGGAGQTGAGPSGPGTGTGAGGGVPFDAGGLDTFTLKFGPVSIDPGLERTQCVVTKLGNTKPIKVGQIHNALTGGSHHLIVYRTTDTEEKLEPFDCNPFTDTLDPTKGSPIMITQKHDETLTLPKGVAYSLEADQMIRLEMHYLNPTNATLQVSAESTFVVMPDAEFENEASFLFIGDPDISINAKSSLTLGPIYFGLPQNLVGSKFFGITGHTHQWGTNVEVAVTDAKDGTDKPIYDVDGWLWSEPATVYQDPPFEVPAGGGFRFTCTWKNASNESVSFGESANAEMCFFWAYYYPSKGSFVCGHTDKIPGGYDACCPGNPFCDQLF